MNVFLEKEIWKKIADIIGKEKLMKYVIYNWWNGAIKCGRFGDGQCWCLQMSEVFNWKEMSTHCF